MIYLCIIFSFSGAHAPSLLFLDSLHGKMHICVYCDCLPNMGEFETTIPRFEV